MKIFEKLAFKFADRNRAPRGTGFSIDHGVPDRGTRYGGAQTIHNTGTIDIVMEDGMVTEVWFRCRQLPFQVADPKGTPRYGQGPNNIVAIEFAEEF